MVEGAGIRFKCPSGFIPEDVRSSVCSSNGVWVPDPGEYQCRGNKSTLDGNNTISYNYVDTCMQVGH